jgi:hypothetical protein
MAGTVCNWRHFARVGRRLTMHSSRSRVAARLNSGVTLLLANAMKFLNLTKLLTLVLSFSSAVLIFSSTAFACNCATPSGKRAIREGSAAFRGTVTKIEYLDAQTGTNEPRIVVTFSVSRVWSGNVKKTFLLHTTENHFSCEGYYFLKDKEYLVVAYPNDEETAKRFDGAKNTFGTNPCGATLPIDLAKNALAELGKGKKPKKGGI